MSRRWAPGITTAQRTTVTLEEREFVFDTDLNRFYVGDGSTVGGLRVANYAELTAADSAMDTRVDVLEALTDNLSAPISAAMTPVVQAASIGAGLDTLLAMRKAVATYAALTALTASTGLVDNGVYCTYGRTAEEDGGFGFWRYDAGSSATANGGTILAIDGGGAGRFFLQSTADIDARWFGAKGDGVTDDTTAIQAALTFAGTLGVSGKTGGDVCLSPGRYLISALLTVPARVTLYSQNSGSTIIKFDAAATAANMVALGNESEVRNLQLDGSNKAGTGVLFNGCENAVASDVYCYDMANQGFATVAGAHDCQIHQCTAESCGDRGLNIGGGLAAQAPSYRINVSHFTSIDNEDAGILIGHSVHDCTINGFVISGTNSANLWVLANAYRNVFKNGTCSAPNADVGDDSQGIWLTQRAYDNVFEGITVQGHLIGITIQGDEISDKTDADTSAGDGDTEGNIISNLVLRGRGSGVANGVGIRLVSHASHKAQFNKVSNVHLIGFESGIKAADANLGDGNVFQSISFDDVTTKLSIGASQYPKQRLYSIEGVTNFGCLSGGDANGISAPAFPNSATEVDNPYPYPVAVYINHDGSGGSLSSLEVLGPTQSTGSGYVAAGTPRDSMLCVPHIVPAGGSIIPAYGTGVAANYSWQWLTVG